MKVALYARVSSERQAEKDLSIPAQLKALKRYALERNWEVVAEYVDEAESARTANRPKSKEMVATARRKPKPFATILVWKLSRFARNREDSIVYKSLLRKHGVQVISINEPVDDSAAGKLLEGMIEVIDEFYSTNLSQDTIRGMKENVERGFYNGGYPPFGYVKAKVRVGNVEKAKLEPNQVEASIVKRIFDMALHGAGAKEIVKTLTRDGLRTRTGKLWSTTAINYILRNEVYTGTLVWNSKDKTFGKALKKPPEEVIHTPNSHAALVSKEGFERVRQLLVDRRPKMRHPRTVTSQYLLSPLLHCAKCGAPMIGAPAKSGTYHYYRCNNNFKKGKEVCSTPLLSKDKVESFIIGRLKEKVLTDENLSDLVRMVNEEMGFLAGRRQERLEEIGRQLESVNQKLLKYYLAFEKGTISDDDAAPRIRELRAEQIKLQGAKEEALVELEDTEPKELETEQVLHYVKDLKALLSKGTFMEQKAFLRSFVKRIDFEPGQIAIDYAIPMPAEGDKASEREVLSIRRFGSPGRIRTYNQAVNSRPLYH
jgi:site-specific DNA recombinase